MKGFRITAVTLVGRDALHEQIREQKKQPLHARLIFGRFFGMAHDEDTLTIQVKDTRIGSLIQPEDIKTKIMQGFAEKGAQEERDYIMEVF